MLADLGREDYGCIASLLSCPVWKVITPPIIVVVAAVRLSRRLKTVGSSEQPKESLPLLFCLWEKARPKAFSAPYQLGDGQFGDSSHNRCLRSSLASLICSLISSLLSLIRSSSSSTLSLTSCLRSGGCALASAVQTIDPRARANAKVSCLTLLFITISYLPVESNAERSIKPIIDV